MIAICLIIIIVEQNIIIIYVYYGLRFSAGETEHRRQHIGFYFAHKRADATGGGNSSIRVGAINTDHMVESYVERMLQVKDSKQHCKQRPC